MLTFTVLVSSVLQLVIALFVLQKKRDNLTNSLFVGLTISSVGWVISNYLTLIEQDVIGILPSLRLILFFVVLQNTFFYLFARTFPKRSWPHRKKTLIAYSLFSVAVALLTISPFVFISAELKNNIPTSNAGPAIMLFILHAFYSTIYGLAILFKKRKKSKGSEKNQLTVLLAAAALNWVAVPLTNFIFTQLFSTTVFIRFSPVYTLLFSVLIAYTIISQKLFDIRSAVARSVAYISSLGILIFLYTQLTIIVTGATLFSSEVTFSQQLINITLAIFAAIIFKPLKRFFDKLTSHLFYRDAYDAQSLIHEMNDFLINTPELSQLLTKTVELVQKTMKIGKVTIVVRDTAYFPARIFGEQKDSKTKFDVEELNGLTKTLKKSVYLVDIDNNDQKHKNLDKLLHEKDYDVLARIVDNPKQELSGVGYILFGPKTSGTSYSSQDLKVIGIIANELVIAIENALRLEEIEQFNVTLQKKIEGATKELKQSNKKLVALDEAKDEFVTMASHQLRTPLTSIKGYISMVQEGDAGKISDPQRKMLGQAFFSAQRMVYLIADLLNVSRLKTGKFVIESKPVNLSKVIKTEVAQLHEGLAAKNLKLEINAPKGFPDAEVDEMKIRQVIMNFLDNAIYYTPQDGKITIDLEEKDNNVNLTVSDTGIGVPKEEQGKLFTKFYRAENAKKARPDGTGLGLFMAKKVIEAHKGSVIFESKVGTGSSFGFSIPLEKGKG